MKTRLPLIALLFCLYANWQFAHGQTSHEDEIQKKLDQIQSMADEQQRTINTLQKHLEAALKNDDQAGAVRLKQEIASAKASKDALQELQSQLKLLVEGLAERARPEVFQPRGLGNPNRRGPDERQLLRAGPELGNPDRVLEHAERFREDYEKSQARKTREPETRIDRLKRSLRDLRVAGEDELARQVEELIKREERILEQQRRREQEEAAARARGARDQSRGGDDHRIKNPGGAVAGKPAGGDQALVAELKILISEMQKEIRDLRAEIKRLKQGDDDGPK